MVQEFENLKTQKTTDYLRLFTQIMVWGFASSGYGPYRTNKYLTNQNNHILIKSGFDYCFEGEFEKSFNTFNKIYGLGVSFISKLMYFATRKRFPSTYPLIFDIMVVRSLIESFDKDILSFIEVMPKSNYKSLALYREIISYNAKKHKVDADWIECILYDRQAHKS